MKRKPDTYLFPGNEVMLYLSSSPDFDDNKVVKVLVRVTSTGMAEIYCDQLRIVNSFCALYPNPEPFKEVNDQ